MALPIELDAVPVVPLAQLADVVEAVAPHLGNRQVPGEGEPLRGALPEQPFRMLPAQLRQLPVVEGGQVGKPGAVEMVVVHAQRGVHGDAELVPPFDDRGLRILPALEHAADVLGVGVCGRAFVAAAGQVADHLEGIARPARRVLADAPEQGVGVGVDQGGVDRFEELLEALRDRGVPVRSAVPVVDEAVVGGAVHRVPFRFPALTRGRFTVPARAGARARRRSGRTSLPVGPGSRSGRFSGRAGAAALAASPAAASRGTGRGSRCGGRTRSGAPPRCRRRR